MLDERLKLLRAVAWTILLVLATMQLWVFRHTISPDGVAYLDLSDAVMQGRFGELLNAYWSPLYPFLIGVVRLAVSWTPLRGEYYEFALAHFVSFAGFVLSLAAFEWMLGVLDTLGARWGQRPFATWWGRVMAYLLFAVATLDMISVAGTVPDFYLTAALFVAFGSLLRLRENPADRASAIRLGMAIGVGALAKSVMFPVGVVILVTLALAVWKRGGRKGVLQSAGVFALLTLPWCVALSIKLGHPTTGETGALNYAWYVNEIQPHNTGVMPALAIPKDSALPVAVGVFPDARGTNPLWYDPARWNRDIRPHFDVKQQLTRLAWSMRYYVYVLAPLLFVLVAVGVASELRDLRTAWSRAFVVLVPSLAALGAYALVYTTSRYLAPFVVAAFLTLVAAFPKDATLDARRLGIAAALTLLAIDWLAPLQSRVLISRTMAVFVTVWLVLDGKPRRWRWAGALAGALLAWALRLDDALGSVLDVAIGGFLWLAVARGARIATEPAYDAGVRRTLAIAGVLAAAVPGLANGVDALLLWNRTPSAEVHADWNFAQQLVREGLAPGSKVAVLGNPESAGWARIARYQIVGVVPESQAEAFVKLDAAGRVRVLSVFAAAGATRLVSRP